jgi:hypothetical protein
VYCENETVVAVSPKAEETPPPLLKRWQLEQMRKAELLSLLEQNKSGHSLTIRNRKAELISALLGE